MTAKPLLSLQGLNPYSLEFLGAARVAQLTSTELGQLRSRRSTRALAAMTQFRTVLWVWQTGLILATGSLLLALAMTLALALGSAHLPGVSQIVVISSFVASFGISGLLVLSAGWLISEGQERLERLAPLHDTPALVESALQRVSEYPVCHQYRDQVLTAGRELLIADFRVIEWLAQNASREELKSVAATQWNQLHDRSFPASAPRS